MVLTQLNSKRREPFAVVRFVDHPSFHEKNAAAIYRGRSDHQRDSTQPVGHLPDEETRELAKRMHYAACRLNAARNSAEKRTWGERYVNLRNQIIVGNRKLVYRAVHSRVRDPQHAEDCIAECHLVMIRAVASYNPFLGIRFSTYAFTCLLRELTRLVQRQIKDRLRQAASFDLTRLDEDLEAEVNEAQSEALELGRFLTADHSLLNSREKQVLSHRFGFNSDGSIRKLSEIGDELKISKERVRQVQISGLEKLREALRADPSGAEIVAHAI
jgi:RNA polymerase sigma factor (sigma-70 family)